MSLSSQPLLMKSHPNKNARAVHNLERAISRLPLTKQEYIRVHTVLLKKKGYSLKKIIDITGKSMVAIQGWITDYNKQSVNGLLAKKRAVAPRRPS